MWSRIVDENVDEDVSQEARYRLADLRYEQGMEAFAEGEYESAVRWLDGAAADINMVGCDNAYGTTPPEAHNIPATLRNEMLFHLGLAYQRLGDWDHAAGVFGRLASRGGPEAEFALLEEVRSLSQVGDVVRARAVCGRLGRRFPGSDTLREAEGLIESTVRRSSDVEGVSSGS